MFSLEQIQTAHSRIKNGSEYPKYVAELRRLSVLSYIYFVADGHTEYLGTGNYQLSSAASPTIRKVSETLDASEFRSQLVANQSGKTTFLEFCGDCAKAGVSSWVADLSALTCSYYSLDGSLVYVEAIPGLSNQLTLEAIDEAHSRVKSGADFPDYIAEIRGFGVREFVTYVDDGRSEYRSADGSILVSPALYDKKTICLEVLFSTFADHLLLHQQGGTTFSQFCEDCARTGVDHWVVDLEALACTYFSLDGAMVVVEEIPAATRD